MATILVIDDRPNERAYLEGLFRHAGYQVMEAEDGLDAVAVMSRNIPNLVVTDLLMPTMDGFEFIRQMRERPATRNTPVILYTAAYDDTATQALVAECPGTTILPKPSEPELVLRIASKLLGESSQELPTLGDGFRSAHLELVTTRLHQKMLALENANAELARSEERFRLVVEAAPSAMIVVGADGRIALVNSHTEKLFGYTRTELIGKEAEILVPERFRGGRDTHRNSFLSAPPERAAGMGRDLFGVRKDGTEVPIEIGLSPITSRDGTFVLASVIDITERKIFENSLKRSLNEKIVLLQEIHHRVKNNLQIISSLLSMQADTIEDQGTVAKLQDSEHRVMSMALIHEQLYQHEDMSAIDLADYIRNLADHLFSSYARSSLITCRLDLAPTIVTLQQAIPCGLILNELITNALKYAYPDGRGEIVVRLSSQADCVCVTVSDEGAGVPGDFSKASKSLGMRIIHALTKQINGQLEIGPPPGACFTIRFSKETPSDRFSDLPGSVQNGQVSDYCGSEASRYFQGRHV